MVQFYSTKNIDLKNLTHEEALIALGNSPMIRDRKRIGLALTRPEWDGFHFFDKNDNYCILTKDGIVLTEPDDIYDLDKDDWMIVEMTENAISLLYNNDSIDYNVHSLCINEPEYMKTFTGITIDEEFGAVNYKFSLIIPDDDSNKSSNICVLFKDGKWNKCNVNEILTSGMNKFEMERLTRENILDLIKITSTERFNLEIHGIKCVGNPELNGKLKNLVISKDSSLGDKFY